MRECLTLRTTISSQLLKNTLLKGFKWAFIGILGLLGGAIFLDRETLQTWGLILFLISLALITAGLLPYRRLSRLQLKPNEICLMNLDDLEFYTKGYKVLSIPLKSISRFEYIHHPIHPGIALWLKPSSPVVDQNYQEAEGLSRQGQQMAGADFFFPYFSYRSFKELMDWQMEEDEDE